MWGILECNIEISHKISYPYIERGDFFRNVHNTRGLILKSSFWNTPGLFLMNGGDSIFVSSSTAVVDFYIDWNATCNVSAVGVIHNDVKLIFEKYQENTAFSVDLQMLKYKYQFP